MRLLFVTHRYPPDGTAGVETYIARLCALALQRGHEVCVWTAAKDVARREATVVRSERDGVPVHAVVENLYGTDFRGTWDDARKHGAFGELLDAFRPDAVHVHHLMYQSVGLLEECARRGVAVLYTLHDFWLGCARFGQLRHADGSRCDRVDPARCGTCLPSLDWRQPDAARRVGKGLALLRSATGLDLSGPLARRHRRGASAARAAAPAFAAPDAQLAAGFESAVMERNRALLEAVSAHVDLVLLPSRFQAPWFEAHGLDAERLRVVPTGLDWDALGAGVERVRDPDGRTRFLFLGTLVPHKGAHVLLDAFATLDAAARARSSLTLHGPADTDPAYVEGLREQAAAVGATLGPRLDRAGVARALGAADVLVVPSLWLEVRPLVIVEAYAAGLRVVASDLGGMAELLGEGIGGRTFAAGDAAALADALVAEVGLDAPEPEPAPAPSAAFPTWDAMFDSVIEATEEARALRQDRA
ncbi:MAG: glycosyltransferase [Planctomycetota bacterium]